MYIQTDISAFCLIYRVRNICDNKEIIGSKFDNIAIFDSFQGYEKSLKISPLSFEKTYQEMFDSNLRDHIDYTQQS